MSRFRFQELKLGKLLTLRFQPEFVGRRLGGLLESGIAKQWYSWEQRVQIFSDKRYVQQVDVNTAEKLKMANIVVVFYAHVIFLFLAALFLICELTVVSCVRLLFLKEFLQSTSGVKSNNEAPPALNTKLVFEAWI